MLERFFRLPENQTIARTEVLAGVTTFLTMAYIIFVQQQAVVVLYFVLVRSKVG
jgi:adenine/guanine/hypoxanthine permease